MTKNNKIIGILFILFILFMFISCKQKDEYDMRKSQEEYGKPGKIETMAALRGVKAGIEGYYKKYKKYPEDLNILINEYFLQEGTDMDAWGNKTIYEPIKNEKGDIISYRLYSVGRDGKGGTSDDIYPPEKEK